jgi:hypothetical protein
MRYLGCHLTVCSIACDDESVIQWEPYTGPYTGGRQANVDIMAHMHESGISCSTYPSSEYSSLRSRLLVQPLLNLQVSCLDPRKHADRTSVDA